MRPTGREALSEWSGAVLIARREIRDQMRDWRILTPIVILTLFFPALMNFTAQQAVSFVSRFGADIVGERLIPFLLMIVGFFPISISLVIALETFAGERERLSLEPLLATPLSDSQLYFGKVMASLVTPLAAAYLGILVYLLGLWTRIGWQPSGQLLVQMFLLTTAQAVVMVSAAVVISSQTTSVRAANLLASFIIVPISQLIIGESLIMFWGRYSVLWWIVLGLMLIAVLLGRMGLHLFNREELLGREIDILNVRWAWSQFWIAFRRGADSPLAWYKDVLGYSIPKLKLAVVFMVIAMLGSYLIGTSLARQFTLPEDLLDFRRLGEGRLLAEMARMGVMSARGWLWILMTNVRAIAFAAFLGTLSFGVLGVVLLMIPVGIIGYFAGNVTLAGQSAPLFVSALVLPHGFIELPAAIIAGAAIINLGLAAVSPPRGMSLGESWLHALAELTRTALAVLLPLLILAAALEVFVTPRIASILLVGP